MYSLSSRSQRRHPFAFFIAIGYGLKYFTLAVTPPGRDRRARSAYARDALVLAARPVSEPGLVISGRHLASGRYTLRGPQEPSGMSTFSAEPTPAPAQRQPMPHARRGRAPCDVTVMRPSTEPEALPPPRDGARSAACERMLSRLSCNRRACGVRRLLERGHRVDPCGSDSATS